MRHPALRRIAATAAKAAVSLGLIAFALRGVDSNVVLQRLRAVDGAAVALAALVATSIALLQARRWQVILERMGHRMPYVEALKLMLIGFFFNQILPSTIGGDAFRAWGAYRLGVRARDAIASVIVDRILALASLVLMIALGSWWLFDIIRTPMARWIVVAVIAGAVAGMSILLSLVRFSPFLARWRPTRFLLDVSEGCRAVLSKGAAALQVALLTIVGYSAMSFAVYVLARGLGVSLGLGSSLLLIPLVTLVAVLPVSIAGWGLRESAMVVALGLIGIEPAQAFSLSILFGLVVMASGIPGGIIWLSTGRHRPAASELAPGPSVSPPER